MKWLKGLLAAIIGGAASSITLLVADPLNFNLTDGWRKLLAVSLVSAITHAAFYLKQSPVPADDDLLLKRMRQTIPVFLLCALLGAAGTTAACAKARHVATLSDASIAQLVFAVDDAEFDAHAQHVISDADHAKLDPIIRNALKDVRGVTAAIQGAPATGGVPATISDVLQDLQAAQAILQQLAQSPDLGPLIARVQAAIAKAGGQ